jgi:DNA polymerase-3 subunit gamma/tau
MQSAPIAESHSVHGSGALATKREEAAPSAEVIPFPVAPAQPEPVIARQSETRQPEIAPAKAADPEPAPPVPVSVVATPGGAVSAETVRNAIVSALAEAGHASAAQLISTARFTLEATSLRIEVPGIGKKMLALTVNAAAEKIIKQEVQKLGGPSRFMVLPGEGAASTSAVTAPAAGSIQQAALENPMVQRAKEIFNAEVRSVVDLRTK